MKIKCVCKNCKKVYYTFPCRLKNGLGIYCSKICAYKNLKGKPKLKNKGNNNGMWKGDKVGYRGVHVWVKNHKPKPELCELCNQRPAYDLANISGQYKRDVNDFKWICRRCHMKSDGRLKILNTIYKGQFKYKIIRPCNYCKKEMILRPASNKIFCSKECFNKFQKGKSFLDRIGKEKELIRRQKISIKNKISWKIWKNNRKNKKVKI